jgi:pyruvate dehydrogenase E1 component
MISGVYRSRFIRYLRDRGLLATDGWRVWGYLATASGRAGINRRPLADRRQKLEHLTFVIDCNLQRLGIDPL